MLSPAGVLGSSHPCCPQPQLLATEGLPTLLGHCPHPPPHPQPPPQWTPEQVSLLAFSSLPVSGLEGGMSQPWTTECESCCLRWPLTVRWVLDTVTIPPSCHQHPQSSLAFPNYSSPLPPPSSLHNGYAHSLLLGNRPTHCPAGHLRRPFPHSLSSSGVSTMVLAQDQNILPSMRSPPPP